MACLTKNVSYILPRTTLDPNNNSPDKTDNIVDKIIKDAKIQYYMGSDNRKRSKTLFYKLVIGGASHVISDVLQKMKQSGGANEEILKWLMCNDNGIPAVNLFPGANRRDEVITLVILGFLWFLLTPVIYVVHAVISHVLNSKRMNNYFSISQYKTMDFPLAFAAMSGDLEMVKLFLDHGIHIDAKDPRGFNIIHYLADYSRNNTAKATKCYNVLKDLLKSDYFNMKDLHQLILDKKARHEVRRQNPVEYAVQFGSPEFATLLMDEIMTKIMLKVSGKQLYVNDEKKKSKPHEEEETKQEKEKSKPGSTFWSHLRMDITRYSSFALRFAYSSYILHLVVARPPPLEAKDSWWCVNNPCMRKWIRLKFSEWQWFIYGSILFEVIVSLLLVFAMLQTGQGDMLLAPNQEIFTTSHVKIFLHKLKDLETQSNLNGPQSMDTAYQLLSGRFFNAYPNLLSDEDPIDYPELVGLMRKLPEDSRMNMSAMADLYDYLCVTGDMYKQVGDYVKLDNCTLEAAETVLPVCEEVGLDFELQYMNRALNETWDDDTKYEFIIATSFVTPIFKGNKLSRYKNPLRYEMNTIVVFGLMLFLCGYFIFYVINDVILRILTLSDQILTNVSLYSVFATPLPGSYIKGQCNLFSSCGFIVLVICLQKQVLEFFATGMDERTTLKWSLLEYDRNSIVNIGNSFFLAFIVVMILVARVILHLHAMKLIPWVGMFVITTFQMATDLMQFAFLYVFIAFAFSLLFHLFSRDETCPSYRDSNNFAVLTSIFSAFALTFGHISINFSNIAVILTYVTYAVTSIILLLNLIIAVMSSTAANVVLEPWASQLYEENMLVEALGIEHWYFKYWMTGRMKKWVRNHAGFNVQPRGRRFNVFVDVFDEFKVEQEEEKEDDEEGDKNSSHL